MTTLPVSTWIIWLGAAILLVIIEVCSGTAAALCLAVGCLLAIIPALAGGSLTVQVIIAVVGALLAFILLAPVMRRYYHRHSGASHASNMDALIGRVGKVTSPVTNNADDKGRVQIDGDSWLAYTRALRTPLPAGTQVKVLHYDSIVLCVEPID